MNALTTFSFILCSFTVNMKITQLIWFSTWIFRVIRECFNRTSIYGREEHEQESFNDRRCLYLFPADVFPQS